MKRILLLSCAALAAAASAQSTKPGLWETSSKVQAAAGSEMAKGMAEAQKAMANLPPEQRKQMQAMMAKQGMSMDMGNDGTVNMKLCVTPEMVNRPPIEQRKDCTYNTPTRVGNNQKFSFKCSNGASGDGDITYSGDSYVSKMNITTPRNGKNETLTINGTGKYLGANCGDVKPFALPKG
jgi:hypothetical protein